MPLLTRVASSLAPAAAIAFLVVVITHMAIRVPFPYEIEWLEGSMADSVSRVARGELLYVSPSLDFIPFLYGPVYYWVAALVSKITGEGLLPLRLVSAFSTLCLFGLIAWLALKETGRRDVALVAAGLFAATFRIGGSWFDVGRVDMLFVLLLFAAIANARHNLHRWSFAATGVLLAAAFFTKQTGAVVGAALVLWLVAVRPRQGVGTALVAAVLGVGGTFLLDWRHDGWYRYYALEMPSNFVMVPRRIVNFFRVDLVPVAVATALALLALVTGNGWRTITFRLAVASGLVAAAVIGRSDDGGYDNVLIPAFAIVSLLAAIGYDTIRRALAVSPALPPVAAALWPTALLLVQFGLLVFNPLKGLPSEASRAAGDALVARLRAAPGEVWVPYHGDLTSKAGKPVKANFMAIGDLLRYGRDDLRRSLEKEIADALAERRFSLVVLSNVPFLFPVGALEGAYERSGPVFTDPDVFYPLTGSHRRPEWLYVPRAASAAPASAPAAPASAPAAPASAPAAPASAPAAP